MRKLFLFMMVSVDGYFEGPEHDITWHHVDEAFGDFVNKQLGEIGSLLFGRRTYELMAGYWPTDVGMHDDPITARLMNEVPKYVFSHTLTQADWQHTTLVNDDAAETVRRLKAEDGKDLAIFGSNQLCVSLMQDGLVDELRIMIAPVVIGDGTPLFHGYKGRLEVSKVGERSFDSGNVLLTYAPQYTTRASSAGAKPE